MYKIIIDSCGELSKEMQEDGHFENVPLTLQIGETEIVDDMTFDQADFLKKVAKVKKDQNQHATSPDAYMQAMDCEAEHIYVITLSSQLSGSYNSACLAKDLFLEDNEDKKICVIDSKSASIGESLIGLHIAACEEAGMDFETVVENVEKYIEEQHTFFVLESLETLRKAGRLSNRKAKLTKYLEYQADYGVYRRGKYPTVSPGKRNEQGFGPYGAVYDGSDTEL